MRLLIEGKGIRKLKGKYGGKISCKEQLIEEKGIAKKILDVSFKNKDILDRSEIEIFNYIQRNCKVIKIVKFSRGFMDLHKVSKTENFKKTLEILKEKINPMYITLGKDGKYWWIGMNDVGKEFDIEEMTKEMYRLGMGMSLVPLDLSRR